MKLKVVAQYKDGKPCDLTLTKEKKVVSFGEVFEVDEARANEILNTMFNGKPVAEVVEEDKPKKVTKTTKANKK